MPALIITDIPRIKAIFQKIDPDGKDALVVSEIHRGIEELDRLAPDLVIIQNHLSGISADIILKHFKSRSAERTVRFALISPSGSMSDETDKSYELILDPNLPESDIASDIDYLLYGRGKKPVRGKNSSPVPQSDEATLPVKQPPPAIDYSLPATSEVLKETEGISYRLPGKANKRIVSAFSQQLDTNSADISPAALHGAPVIEYYRDRDLAIRDLHNKEHLLVDPDMVVPLYRRPAFLLVTATLLLVVGITLFQHRTSQPRKQLPLEIPVKAKQISSIRQQPATSTSPLDAANPIPPDKIISHGPGRPAKLPSFMPLSGLDPSYGKEHPGWESYRGATSEYRVFREPDSTIKAIQVIDRSGSGMQESFYISALKELAGATAMRTTSSEIKEGYEIRKGEVAGLQLVQYRDAQGGRLRGFVVTWP